MAGISREIGRQIGILIDRRGNIEQVIIGNAERLYMPDFGRLGESAGRLRNLRLVHTHLKGEPLSEEDLGDMALLRLDMVAALEVDEKGFPGNIQYAHLLPENDEKKRFWISDPISVHHLNEDFLELMSALEDQFSQLKGRQVHKLRFTDRAFLVGVTTESSAIQDERLDELAQLAETAGVEVVGRVVQRRFQIDPKYILGVGRLRELLIECMQADADLLIFDRELSPAQLRSIAEFTDMKVIDRTQLILDIFAGRAQTRDGRIQVELAQLKYRLPRLAQKKDRAFSRLMGGIGGRGPGEQKLEIDRRVTRDRIALLEREIEKLSEQRRLRREKRKRNDVPVVGLVGYTNAGKSTLLNRLTNSNVFVENKLFATLDPTSRRLRFPDEREMLLVDTVGFIRELPQELISAFKATLEELNETDLLLHVVDISSPQCEQQMSSVDRILKDMQLSGIPQIVVYNKIDMLPEDVEIEKPDSGRFVCISAHNGTGLPDLVNMIRREVGKAVKHRESARNSQSGRHVG